MSEALERSDPEDDYYCEFCGKALEHEGMFCDDTCRDRDRRALIQALTDCPTLSEEQRAELLRGIKA